MTVGIDARLKLISGDLYDLDLNSIGDIQSEDFFDTAIIVSLFAERRANESEVLDSALRRGWIGNEVTPDFEIGSKIWLYEQSRLTRSVLNNISIAARQSLQWLVNDGYALSIDNVEAIATTTGVDLNITIRRPNSKVEKRHFTLWDNTALPADRNYAVIDLGSGDAGMNIFHYLGSPAAIYDVVVNVPANLYPTQSSGLIIGGPWHPETKIVIVISSGVSIIGSGGEGGFGAYNGATNEYGGGGGGGRPYGPGGGSYNNLANGTDGTFGAPGVGGIGASYAVTSDRLDVDDGDPGYSGISLGHNVTINNYGTIVGGGGGGGGAGYAQHDGGDGGELATAGTNGGGVTHGDGGAAGKAIELNGYNITWINTGTIIGDIS